MRTRLSRSIGGRVVLLLAIIGLAGRCATNPATGKKEVVAMSENQEIEIGQQADQEVRKEMGTYDDPELQEYVAGVGMRLAQNSERPNLPWHFTIIDVPAVNAFALPGGYIYLTRGIMPYLDDESELAGVLGHEIGHVTARHAVQMYTKATGASLGLTIASIFFPAARPFGQVAETGLGLLFLKYGRDDEMQADQLGARYTARSGWDPSGVPDLLSTLARIEEVSDRRGIPNWLSTHPHPADRVVRVQATVNELKSSSQTRFTSDRDGYLRRINGMVYGDNPREGIVRASSFLHPELRFALRFPEGWDVTNGKTQVVAKQPGADVYIVLQLVEQPRGRNLDDVAVGGMRQAGFRQLEGGPTDVNGLNAYVGTYQGRMQNLGTVVTRAAHVVLDRKIYLIAGIAQPDAFDRVAPEFGTTIRSFRGMSRAEAADVRPNRVGLYTARSGDTWQSIAQHEGGENVKASTLAIMNNHAVNDPPRPGERLKIVTAG